MTKRSGVESHPTSVGRWLAVATLSVLVGIFARDVEAAASVRLDFGGGPGVGCTADDLRRTADRAGMGGIFSELAKQRVTVTVESVHPGLRAHLLFLDGKAQVMGKRTLDADSCTALYESIVFVLSLFVQPEFASPSEIKRQSGSSPAQARSRPQPSAPAKSQTDPVVADLAWPAELPEASRVDSGPSLANKALVSAQPQSQVAAGGGLAAGVASGRTPGPAPWFELTGRLTLWRRFSIEVAADTTLRSRWDQVDGTGFSAIDSGAALRPCFAAGAGRVCLVGRLSRLSLQGFGVDQPRSQSLVRPSAGFRFGIEAPSAWSRGALKVGVVAEGTMAPDTGSATLGGTAVWHVPRISAVFAAIFVWQ